MADNTESGTVIAGVFQSVEKAVRPVGGRFPPAPGPGRPKGSKNRTTLLQREVAEMVLGKPGTPEFDDFVKSQRVQLLAGILPPAIVLQWMNYLMGKPIERVEVKDTTDDVVDNLTVEQLRERAKAIAQRVITRSETSESLH